MLVDFKTIFVHYIHSVLISSLFLVEQKIDLTANFTRESVEPGTHRVTMVCCLTTLLYINIYTYHRPERSNSIGGRKSKHIHPVK